MQASKDNRQTVAVYEQCAATFIQKTSSVTSGIPKQWIDESLALRPPESPILELGSGGGRDASYIKSLGHNLISSDAAKSFLQVLTERGLNPVQLNAITDPISGPYGMVLANCVFLHFHQPELSHVLDKLHTALLPEGVLSCSFKFGNKAFWDGHKTGIPRFFQLWLPEDIITLLRAHGFDTKSMRFGTDGSTVDKFYISAIKQ